MKVKILFFTNLREITRKKEEEIELPNTATIGQLLNHVSEKYGQLFIKYLYDEKGDARSHLTFLVNRRNATNLQGNKTKLRDGDKVAIIPPIGGG